MNPLTIFGLFAVTAMLVFYALEKRSHWFILAFAGSACSARPMDFFKAPGRSVLVEAVWSVVAVRRWWVASARDR